MSSTRLTATSPAFSNEQYTMTAIRQYQTSRNLRSRHRYFSKSRFRGERACYGLTSATKES